MKKEIEVIETEKEVKDIKNQCPNCGARELHYDIKLKKITCSFCNSTFEGKELNIDNDIEKLDKEKIGSGAKDIDKNFKDIITYRCPGCGAEVIINTKESTQAKCHWCQGILTINERIENGTVPDAILPFTLTKEEAMNLIEQYLSNRKFFADKTFKDNFKSDNTQGIYFPYLLHDVNAHCIFIGTAEEETRRYEEEDTFDKEKKTTYYDANVYDISREFDIAIDDLTIETIYNNKTEDNQITDNIINAILPFDTKNCITFESKYLVGYHSENRNLNIKDMKNKLNEEVKDIARNNIKNTLKKYDRGVNWTTEEVQTKGTQSITAYLPIWLYSYQEVKNNKKILHYIAVNGRTKKVVGSVPINKPKLIITSSLLGVPGTIFLINNIIDVRTTIGFSSILMTNGIFIILLIILPVLLFYNIKYNKYSNKNARHYYEKETKNEISNMQMKDKYIKERTRLTSSSISGENSNRVKGIYTKIDNQDEQSED